MAQTRLHWRRCVHAVGLWVGRVAGQMRPQRQTTRARWESNAFCGGAEMWAGSVKDPGAVGVRRDRRST